jgi:hypothetical protein
MASLYHRSELGDIIKKVIDRNNKINYYPGMKKHFEALKARFGTHKAAAKAIGVSYSRYCQWRWCPDKMPERSRKLVELAAEQPANK